MKAKELRELSVAELRKRSSALRKERVLMRLQNASGSLEGTARFGIISRDVARIETILTERRRNVATKA
jgi:large subunit ribosomal protein L29